MSEVRESIENAERMLREGDEDAAFDTLRKFWSIEDTLKTIRILKVKIKFQSEEVNIIGTIGSV